MADRNLEREYEEALSVAEEAMADLRAIRYQQALEGDLDWFPWLEEMCRRVGDARNGLAVNLLIVLSPCCALAMVHFWIYPDWRWFRLKLGLMLFFSGVFVAIGSIPIYWYHCWRARRARNAEEI